MFDDGQSVSLRPMGYLSLEPKTGDGEPVKIYGFKGVAVERLETTVAS